MLIFQIQRQICVNSRSQRASGSIDRSRVVLHQRVSEKSCELERWDFRDFLIRARADPPKSVFYIFRIVKNIGNSGRPLTTFDYLVGWSDSTKKPANIFIRSSYYLWLRNILALAYPLNTYDAIWHHDEHVGIMRVRIYRCGTSQQGTRHLKVLGSCPATQSAIKWTRKKAKVTSNQAHPH